MHTRIDDLLSIRDGEPAPADVVEHVSACARCSAELRALTAQRDALRALPAHAAPDVWSQVRQPPRHKSLARWAAALAMFVVGTLLVIGYRADMETSEPIPVVPPHDAQVSGLIERSHELEHALQTLPQRPALERAGTAATIDGLERRIQWLDHHLNYAPDAGLDAAQTAQLWEERVVLLDTLVKVRYAESGPYAF